MHARADIKVTQEARAVIVPERRGALLHEVRHGPCPIPSSVTALCDDLGHPASKCSTA